METDPEDTFFKEHGKEIALSALTSLGFLGVIGVVAAKRLHEKRTDRQINPSDVLSNDIPEAEAR